ncbi:flagellar basal body-associated protein FliL [Alishewanella jeotgali]|uniref:Flagellar protein FliL n=1 Tax=Alishewanella jeotgali KCTC 22429 TaxID=1129374 RepID=H3ZBG9_9ALTE|nr:flagellar basal body-associated protein FliL [Alishewanella jeotgali]EHR42283.1 flagellar basal body-associated protein FliL [Alishewanella jeotgali KCTC 22429]
MADNELELVDQAAKRKKILMLGVVLLVLLGAVGAYFWFAGSTPTPASQSDGGTVTEASQPAAMQGTALYIQMPRPFVFNVAGSNRDRLVQIRVQLMVRGDANQALALRHIPLIEGTLLATFSAASADELITTTGKEELKNRALIDLQNAMLGVVGTVVVAEVLFTGFVMQ